MDVDGHDEEPEWLQRVHNLAGGRGFLPNGAQQQKATRQTASLPLLQTGNPYIDSAIKIGSAVQEELPEIEKEAPAIENEMAGLIQKAKDLYPKLAENKDQLHHIIPKYLGGAKDGVMVRLPAAYHQLITNAIRELAPYGQGLARSQQEVNEILEKVYKTFPIHGFEIH